MANKDLKDKLDDLFSDLDELPVSGEVTGSLQLAYDDHPELQLDGLFSDPDTPFVSDRAAPVQTNGAKSLRRVGPSPPRPAAPPDGAAGRSPAESRPIILRQKTGPHLPAIHNKWDIEPLLEAAVDPDREVARLALSTLRQMAPAVTGSVLALGQEPDQVLRQGAEAYVSYLLGEPFLYISPTPFLMGSHPAVDTMADANEQPLHEVLLPGYWIARFPEVCVRFQSFVKETGYQPLGTGWQESPGNYPVVDVSWFDAMAYCRWLSHRSGLHVTLASEAEWEKAARGTDGRRYPWGNHQPTPELCNFENLTPVGQYSPYGDSPFGCADMVGNVWEWTRSAYAPYPYDPADGRESLTGDSVRAIRGVTFININQSTRCAFRYRLKANLRLPTLGFRVVVLAT